MSIERLPSRAGSLPLVGGVLALDFCNTSSGRGTAGHREQLQSVGNLLAWARHAGIIGATQEAALEKRWGDDPSRAGHVLDRTVRLREIIHQLVAELAAHGTADAAIVEAIGREQAACLSTARLTTRDGGFGWTWSLDDAPEDVILGPIVASAITLIATADRARLKQCVGHQCGWLFLDTTKSNNRRWCEMEVCGNRAKQKRRRAQPRSDL